jgi:threonine dehydrogenase-like Zn-dependent dehydrogenase
MRWAAPLVKTVKATGSIGVVGVFVAKDPGAKDPLAKDGHMDVNFGEFWFKGQQIRPGQANVKAYNRRLINLIEAGKATPSFFVPHELALVEAPDAYRKCDARKKGWTKVVLKPGA